MTGLYPWLGYQVTDRVSVWGVTGYGAGGLWLTRDGGPALRSGLLMAMAAAGTRGELVAGGAGGFALAFKADALWVGTSIDGVDGAAGRLAATDAAVSRFRTGLEGSRAYTLAGRLSLRPSTEIGLRHDGGDAETGAGMDVGGGLVVSDSSTGLAVDLRVRMLVMHQAEGFRERSLALSLSYNPTPSTPLGLTARVAPSWGGQATSGAEALWGRETMAGMAHGGVADGTRLDAELGYGLPVGSRFVGTPTVGVGTSAYGRDYRLGYRLGALGGAGDDGRVWCRCAAAGEPPGGRHGSRRARAGHGGLVTAARFRAPRHRQPCGHQTCARTAAHARSRRPAAHVGVPGGPGRARRGSLARHYATRDFFRQMPKPATGPLFPRPRRFRRSRHCRAAGAPARRAVGGLAHAGRHPASRDGRRVPGHRGAEWRGKATAPSSTTRRGTSRPTRRPTRPSSSSSPH